jgi:hypothetical protein
VQSLDTLGLYLGRLTAIGLQPLQIAASAEGGTFAGDDNAADFKASMPAA